MNSSARRRAPARVRLSREESRQLTKERLKEAALQEFARTGFGGASIDRIAEAAGYSRGAFYANYESKNDLLLALVAEFSRLEIERWRESVLKDARSGELIEVSSAAFAGVLRDSDWCFCAIEAQMQAQRDPEFAASYRALMQEVLAAVQEFVTSNFRIHRRQVPEDVAEIASALYGFALGLGLNLDMEDPFRDAAAAGRMLGRFVSALINTADMA